MSNASKADNRAQDWGWTQGAEAYVYYGLVRPNGRSYINNVLCLFGQSSPLGG